MPDVRPPSCVSAGMRKTLLLALLAVYTFHIKVTDARTALFANPHFDELKLSPEQRKRLDEIQKEIDAKLATLLTSEQRQQLQGMQQGPLAGPGGPGRGGPPGGLPVFRAYRYATNYPAFAGKKLISGRELKE